MISNEYIRAWLQTEEENDRIVTSKELFKFISDTTGITDENMLPDLKAIALDYNRGETTTDKDKNIEIAVNTIQHMLIKRYPQYYLNGERPFAENDPVNHPSHYTSGKYETIDIIQDKLTPEQFEGFCVGNVIKYVTRYGKKNGLEDLEKALWYLNKIIEVKKNDRTSD